MRGRRRRSGDSRLAAFLAAAADLFGLARALDPNQCAAGRPRTGCFRLMLNNHRFGPPRRWRWSFASFRRPGLSADYSNRALDRSRVVAAVHAPGGRTGTIARLPDGGVGRLDARTLTGTARPPIGWARLIVAPDDEVVIVPIEVVVKPCPDREAEPKGDERAAEWPLVIDHVRLIHGHIDHLRVDREDFNGSAVGTNVLLRGGLQVAQRLGSEEHTSE